MSLSDFFATRTLQATLATFVEAIVQTFTAVNFTATNVNATTVTATNVASTTVTATTTNTTNLNIDGEPLATVIQNEIGSLVTPELPRDFTVYWSRFNYMGYQYQNVFWYTTTTMNGPPWNNASSIWTVNTNIVLPFTGIYRVCVCYGTGHDQPVLHFEIDTAPTPVDVSIDMYSGNNPQIMASYIFQFTANAGTYTLTLSTPTKNGDSTGFYFAPAQQGIMFSYMGV